MSPSPSAGLRAHNGSMARVEGGASGRASPVSAFHGDSRLRHPVMSTLLVKSMKHAPTMGTTR